MTTIISTIILFVLIYVAKQQLDEMEMKSGARY